MTVAWLQLRYLVFGGESGDPRGVPFGNLLLSLPMVFTRYMGLILGLVPVDPHHADPLCQTAWSMAFLANLVAVLSYCALVVLCYLSRRKQLLFSLLWFPVTLGPVFMLGHFGDVLYADRFLYIPSVGPIWAGVLFVYGLTAKKGWAVKSAVLVFLSAYLVLNICYSRNCSAYWKDNITLFSKAVQTSRKSPYILFNLARSLSDAEAWEQALKAYEKTIRLVPGFGEAYSNKAYVLNQLGRHAEALAACRSAMDLGRMNHTTLIHMGDAFMGLGEKIDGPKLLSGRTC